MTKRTNETNLRRCFKRLHGKKFTHKGLRAAVARIRIKLIREIPTHLGTSDIIRYAQANGWIKKIVDPITKETYLIIDIWTTPDEDWMRGKLCNRVLRHSIENFSPTCIKLSSGAIIRWSLEDVKGPDRKPNQRLVVKLDGKPIYQS